MKKTLSILIFLFISTLILTGCKPTIFPLPFTAEEIANYEGLPDEVKIVPTTKTFILPARLTNDIKNRMTGGQFTTNELRLVTTCGAIYPFPGRNNVNTNGFMFNTLPLTIDNAPWGTLANFAITMPVYSAGLMYYYWADSSWGGGNHDIDGGDITGSWTAGVNRRSTVQVYQVALALESAGYIQEAMLAYYYVMMWTYRCYKTTGTPITVFGEAIAGQPQPSWVPAEAALAHLKKLTNLYGEAMGIKYIEGKIDGIGTVAATWLYPEYDINPGRFVPYSE